MPRWAGFHGQGGGAQNIDGTDKTFLSSFRVPCPPPTTIFSHLLSSFFLCTFRFVGDWTIHSPHQNFWRTNLEETTLRSRFQRRFLWTFRCVSLGHDRRMQTDKNGKEEQKRKGKDDISPPSPAQRNKKKGNSIPMDPKLKKEKEKPEASSREAWWEHQSKKGIFPV